MTARTFTFTVQAATPPPSSSALQTACNALATGQSVIYTAAGANQFAGGFEDGMQQGLAYHVNWHFSGGIGHVKFLGHSTNLAYYRYVESTDAWTRLGLWTPPGVGHDYGSGNAIDPATQRVWWMRPASSQAFLWNGTTFAQDFTYGTTVDANAFCWHPNLGASGSLVWWSYSTIMRWDSATRTVSTLSSSVASGGYNGAAYYHSASDSVLLFNGSSGLSCYSVSASGAVTLRPSTPVNVRNNAGAGALPVLSNSGAMLLLERGDAGSRVWKLNDALTAWELQAFTHPFHGAIGGVEFADPKAYWIATNAYGCVWAIGNAPLNQKMRTALWKPPV